MDKVASNPALFAFALLAIALWLNLVGLWIGSGVARAMSKTAINPEDSERFGAPLVETDPPGVARVLRAHANAQAASYPFLFLALAYVLLGGDAATARVLFGTFVAARFLHSAMYLAGKQPWRTICFVGGLLTTLALVVGVVGLLVRGAGAI